MSRIDPISTSVYLANRPEPVAGFRFHLTLYQGAHEAGHANGRHAAEGMTLSARVDANGIGLFGRANRHAGHEWRQLEDYPFTTN